MDEIFTKLNKDVITAGKKLTTQEVRYLVDYYYIMQEDRKRANNQVRALDKNQEPNSVIQYLAKNANNLEKEIGKILDVYTQGHEVGEWLRGVVGIGPIIAAGLLAHIDITRAPTAGHIWRYAGLDPTSKWEKKTKRPWNAQLKTLCWKIGQSFMKQDEDKCIYGKLYRQRKEREHQKNEAGDYKDQAKEGATRVGKDTEAYKSYIIGKLPKGHIDARARRYATKIFLSHLHAEWYRVHYKKEPPVPYPIAILGHVHMIRPIHKSKS